MDKEFQAHETAVIDAGCCIGRGTVVWHFSHLMSGCIVGERCSIGQNVVISPGVVLGNGVKVQNNVSVYTGVTCEDDVFLGPSCVFTNVINPRSAVPRKDEFRPARHIGWVSEYGHRLRFDADGRATCPESGARYLLKERKVVRVDE